MDQNYENAKATAMCKGDIHLLRFLNKMKVDLLKNIDSDICRVVSSKNLNAIKYLIDLNADISKNPKILSDALYTKRTEIIEYILDQKIDISLGNPLSPAVRFGDINLVETLISHKATVQSDYPYCNETENIDMIRLLIKNKANVNAKNYTSCLELACIDNRLDIVKLLIENKADLKQDNPVRSMCSRGNLYMTKFLIENNAMPDFENHTFSYACGSGNFELVKYLLELKANPLENDNQPILYTCKTGNIHTINYLVELKADVTAQNNQALINAVENHQIKTVEYLVTLKADVTAQDNYALKSTLRNNNFKGAIRLLSIGANPLKIPQNYRTYFREYFAYRKWRLVYFKRWIRRVLIPLYFSPTNLGGIQAKKDLNCFVTNCLPFEN